MAMTLLQKTDMYRFFSIAFNAAPGVTYMTQLDAALASGMDTKQVVNVFTTKAEFTSVYPTFLDNATFASKLVENVVGTSAAAADKAQAVIDIGAALTSGMTRGDVVYQIFNNLAAKTADATWGATATMMANKVAVAAYYTETLATDTTNLAALRGVLAGVTAKTDVSTPAALAAALPAATTVVNTSLTIGQDNLFGTSLADFFNANVVQNSSGAQVNTLGSGDKIVGGAGIDTLSAKITAGAFVGSSALAVGGVTSSMPIQPETSGVELIKLQAVNANIVGAGATTEVFVSAKDMVDVTKIASNHSDANLTIQNLTTLEASGGMRNVNTMTVGMEYTGNADSRWEESDMHVYFDQDYLNPSITRTNPSIEFKILNEDGYDATINTTGGVLPLGGVTVGQMDIHLNDVTFKLAPLLSEVADAKGIAIQTYAQLLAAVQASLVTLKAANPTNLALQSVQATLGKTFFTDISPITGKLREGTSIVLTAEGTTGTTANKLTVTAIDLQIVRATDPTALANNNRYERAGATPSTDGQELVINVALEKVGLAGDGGALVIGSMFKDGSNTWSDLYEGKGINEFKTTVYGASDKPSSLSELASTGNNLKIVTVATDAAQTGTYASLTIGNSQTKVSQISAPLANAKTAAPSVLNEQALKDVRTFDATGMKADVTLFAGLSKEVTAKYIDVKDIAANPAIDNMNFAYSTGLGKDTINLHMDAANLAKPGTGTREDFTLTINTNAGDDNVVTMVGDGTTGAVGVNSNWYANQHINANLVVAGGSATGQLQINTGDGNDTVRTMGSGDYAINAGAGNDTVYADNTGAKTGFVTTTAAPLNNEGRAIWTFNTATSVGSDDVNNLLSKPAVAAQTNVVNLGLKVTFKGLVATANITTAGATTGTSVTDLSINQAIKAAINTDPVLSKLLVAEDGPGRTLVVRDLIDGVQAGGDVVVSLVSSALSVGQIPLSLAAVNPIHLLDTAQASLLGFGPAATVNGVLTYAAITDVTTPNVRFVSYLGTDAALTTYTGANSSNTADNFIVGGAGNEVLVLGTGALSNDTIVFGPAFSNVVAGVAIGSDTVVNFATPTTNARDVAAGKPAQGLDRIDFSSIGGTAAGLSTVDKSIVVGALDTTAAVAGVFGTSTVAQTHVYVSVSGTVGKVYSVVSAANTPSVATLEGAINLANSTWADVTFGTAAFTAPAGPVFTNSSVDTLGSDAVPGLPAVLATSGAINYTDAVGVRSNVSLLGFGADDQITITGSTALLYNTAISSAGADVTVSYNNAGTLNIINLVGVNTAGAFVNDVASFNALAVGNLIFA